MVHPAVATLAALAGKIDRGASLQFRVTLFVAIDAL
jgi:hypothetical protein